MMLGQSLKDSHSRGALYSYCRLLTAVMSAFSDPNDIVETTIEEAVMERIARVQKRLMSETTTLSRFQTIGVAAKNEPEASRSTKKKKNRRSKASRRTRFR